MDRFPLPAFPPPTISSNHSDSTNVRCCTSPARLVPESTVLRRGVGVAESRQLLEHTRALRFERREQLFDFTSHAEDVTARVRLSPGWPQGLRGTPWTSGLTSH